MCRQLMVYPVESQLLTANVTGFWRFPLLLSEKYVYSTLTTVSHASLFHCGKFYMYTYSFECEGNLS